MSEQTPQRPDQQRTEQRSEQRAQAPFQVLRTAENRFTHDKSRQPPGMDYQWKRTKIWGRPDEEHQINMQANGWTPVPASRHPELTGARAGKDAFVERGGQMLMERPKELTDQARAIDKAKANDQIATQLKRVGQESRQRGFEKTSVKHGEFSKIPE